MGNGTYAGYLYEQASAYTVFTTAVPEPQSAALLLAGLALLSAGVERRQS
ncbi:PEP-CTERM sorting domain-containing protein [Pelomonas sp. Root1217]|nr:PEP-CTERM sorting domain-containing protein [Pelomonas sp. Root1217]